MDAIGLIVISEAVFDIAKYPYDEQVVRERELRSPREAPQTLRKFLAIITITVTLRYLAFIFKTGTTNIRELSYSTGLLMTPVIRVIGLGWYQRLGARIEYKSKAWLLSVGSCTSVYRNRRISW